MLMPDVTQLLEDDDLGAQQFTITRRTGQWDEGDFVVKSTETITATGIIQPPSSEELSFFPEGERRKGLIAIWTKTPMHLTEGEEITDDVTWRSEQYKVIRIDRWSDYGYCVAYAQKR